MWQSHEICRSRGEIHSIRALCVVPLRALAVSGSRGIMVRVHISYDGMMKVGNMTTWSVPGYCIHGFTNGLVP